MRGLVIALAMFVQAGTAMAATVGFENVAFDNYFSWHGVGGPIQCSTYFTQQTGYCTGQKTPGGDRVAWVNREFSDPAIISRTSGEEFLFKSVYLTGAWQDNLEATLTAYNDGKFVGTASFIVGSDAAVQARPGFGYITELYVFWSTVGQEGGGPGGGPHIVLDEFKYFAPVPLPPSLHVGIIGLASFGFFARRRKTSSAR